MCKNELIKDKTIENISAHKNPSTLNPGTKFAVKIITKAFITKVNNPKVRILIGRVNIKRIGFTKALITPNTTAATKAAVKLETVTPGSKYEVTKIAKALTTQLIKMLIVLLLLFYEKYGRPQKLIGFTTL